MKLDNHAQDTLDKRIAIGDRCIAIAAEGVDSDSYYVEDAAEERETHASDAVSDILTALFGAAGTWDEASRTPDGRAHIVHDFVKHGTAKEFLDHCLQSWIGDAEDYFSGDES